jgi:hypothetical protein
MKRDAVYREIDKERDYQDALSAERTDGSHKTVGDYLTMLSTYQRKAEDAWTNNPGTKMALHEIRKIATICVRCMEEHGVPTRGFR